MNTVKKGNDFEDRVYQMICQMINDDTFFLPGKFCKVYQKKGYYSKERDANIIIDISVECTIHNASNPSMYVLIECKDLKHAVPVDDVEEFCKKTTQITGLNVKAMFVTSSILQPSAFNVARSNGIWVMRLKLDGQTETFSFRKEKSAISSDSRDIINAHLDLTSEGRAMISSRQVGVGTANVYFRLNEMLRDILIT